MKIGVVGSGISGLSAAYYLSKKHQVDLFEKEDHFGGHSHTIDLNINTKKIAVDIGFIVFNFKTYPNLKNFIDNQMILPENGRKAPIYNPAIGKATGEVILSNSEETKRAIGAASKAFKEWSENNK